MKRILKILVIAILLVNVIGCNKKESNVIKNEKEKISNEYNEQVFQIKVINDYINIRKSNSVNSDDLGQVHKDDIFTVIDYKADDKYIWFHIKTNNNIDGYIASEKDNPYVEYLNLKNDLDVEPPTLELKKDTLTIKNRSDLTIDKIKEIINYSDDKSPVEITYNVDYKETTTDNFTYNLYITATDSNNNQTSKQALVKFVNEKQVSDGKWLTYEKAIELQDKFRNICKSIGGKVISNYSCQLSHSDHSYWQVYEYGMYIIGTDDNFSGFHGVDCEYRTFSLDAEPTNCYKATPNHESITPVDYLLIEDEMKKIDSKYKKEIQEKLIDKFLETGYTLEDIYWQN